VNPDEPLRTKDLAKEDPAPMEDTLAGYQWLPRMIDKARASRAGTLGQYFRYPCPIDQEALARIGLDSEQFAEVADCATTANDVLESLAAHGARSAQEAAFDPIELNRRLHEPPLDSPEVGGGS